MEKKQTEEKKKKQDKTVYVIVDYRNETDETDKITA